MIDAHTALLDKPALAPGQHATQPLIQDKIMAEFKLDRLPDYQEETLIAEVRRVADIIVTDKISRTEFDEHGLIGSSGLRKRFGSWQAVLEKAGLGHRYCEPSYSPQTMRHPPATFRTRNSLRSWQVFHVSPVRVVSRNPSSPSTRTLTRTISLVDLDHGVLRSKWLAYNRAPVARDILTRSVSRTCSRSGPIMVVLPSIGK